MAQDRLEGLDLLRGIAALSVMGFHVGVIFPQIETPFSRAYLAVDFFFMLSGLVLTRTYHQRFQEGLGAAAFMALRLRRLWPTVAIGAVLGLASQLSIYEPDQLVWFFVMNLALVPYLAGGVVFPLNGVIWSIWFELVANFIHARGLARLSQAALLALALAMAALMVACVVKLETLGAGTWDTGSWQGNFAAGLPRVLLSYVIGSLLFLRFGDRPRWNVSGVVAPILLAGGLFLSGWLEGSWVVDAVFVIVLCPLIVLMGMTQIERGRWIGRVAGDLSFPLYAVHVPVFILVAQAGLPWIAAPAAAIAAAAAVLQVTRSQSRAKGGRDLSAVVGA